MAQGTVTYSGVVAPKGATYTQTLGVHPDKIIIRCVPQTTAVSTRGSITLAYDGGSLVIRDCFFDNAQVVADVQHGFLLSLAFDDRRAAWAKADTISGVYNIWRAGEQITSKKKSLRELATILLEHMGETSPNVTALSNSIYPEVRWADESPVEALQELLYEWGFSVSLGFGTEAVKVVQLGTGASLSTTAAMMASSTIDPKIRPTHVRVRFAPSLMQARFLLEAVALETDNTWVPIADVSYEPSVTWASEHPERLPNLSQTASADVLARAQATVYRAFRIKAFADGTLNIPDGSGTLTSIEQCLPLQNRLLDNETIRDDGSAIPFRVYGKRFIPAAKNGEPAEDSTSTIDDQITNENVVFDGENGIIIFERPQWYENAEAYFPAELYLECSFSIVDLTNNYPYRYKKDVSVDPSGTGYHVVRNYDVEGRTVVAYGSSQAVSGSTNNQTDLDALAALMAASVSSQYSTTGMQVVAYNQPVFSLRCDGAIHQVQHVISDGTDYAGSFSTASRNAEFDRFIHTRDERAAARRSLTGLYTARSDASLPRRTEAADD